MEVVVLKAKEETKIYDSEHRAEHARFESKLDDPGKQSRRAFHAVAPLRLP